MDGFIRRPRIPRAPEHGTGGGAGQGGRGDAPGTGSSAKPVTPPRNARPLVPGIPSRVVDPSGVVKHTTRGPAGGSAASASGSSETQGQLVVGRDIAFKGEIGACDRLVVHGEVEARLSARSLDVGADGRFRGTVEVETAEIAGRFQGTLTVHGVLTLREGGRVEGTVRYGELAVERGGQVAGDVDTLDAAAPEADQPDPATTAADAHAGETVAAEPAAGETDAPHEPADPQSERSQPASTDAAAAAAKPAPEQAPEAPEMPLQQPGPGPADRAVSEAAEAADVPLPPRRSGDGSERRLFRHGDRARRLREYAERDL